MVKGLCQSLNAAKYDRLLPSYLLILLTSTKVNAEFMWPVEGKVLSFNDKSFVVKSLNLGLAHTQEKS